MPKKKKVTETAPKEPQIKHHAFFHFSKDAAIGVTLFEDDTVCINLYSNDSEYSKTIDMKGE